MRFAIAAASIVAVAAAGNLDLPYYSSESASATDSYYSSSTEAAEYSSSTPVYGYGTTTAAAYPTSSGYGAPVSYVTETYDTYTTTCSEATTFTYGTHTYAATGPTTFYIPSCTITKPVYTSMVTSCSSSAAAVYTPAPYSAPCNSSSAAAQAATGTMSAYPAYTGAANKVVGSGMGVAAIMAVAAFL